MKANREITCTCCFTPSTRIFMADDSQKCIKEVRIGDKIASINGEIKEVGCDVQEEAEEYFVLKTKGGHKLELSGDHPVLTVNGWEQARTLRKGDKVACQDGALTEHYYEEVESLELKEEHSEMYNLICDDCAIIANGIVCGDFHVQFKLQFKMQFRKK